MDRSECMSMTMFAVLEKMVPTAATAPASAPTPVPATFLHVCSCKKPINGRASNARQMQTAVWSVHSRLLEASCSQHRASGGAPKLVLVPCGLPSR